VCDEGKRKGRGVKRRALKKQKEFGKPCPKYVAHKHLIKDYCNTLNIIFGRFKDVCINRHSY